MAQELTALQKANKHLAALEMECSTRKSRVEQERLKLEDTKKRLAAADTEFDAAIRAYDGALQTAANQRAVIAKLKSAQLIAESNALHGVQP